MVQVASINNNGALQWGHTDDEIHDLLELDLIAPIQVSTAPNAVGCLLDTRVNKATFFHGSFEYVMWLTRHQCTHVRNCYFGTVVVARPSQKLLVVSITVTRGRPTHGRQAGMA
ncbi:hypothetical protein D3C86_989110 [compost metagenome]